MPDWHNLGPVSQLRKQSLSQLVIGRTKIALSCVNERFAAISGVCNHAGGPLGDGRLDGAYIVCSWFALGRAWIVPSAFGSVHPRFGSPAVAVVFVGIAASPDDGTIGPMAAGGSVPFAPEETITALKAMRARYGEDLFQEYGFLDAFNPIIRDAGIALPSSRVVPGKGWFNKDYSGSIRDQSC